MSNRLDFRQIPNVGEHIFEHIETTQLIDIRKVSRSWKEVAETTLVKRWRSKTGVFFACKNNAFIVKMLLELTPLIGTWKTW